MKSCQRHFTAVICLIILTIPFGSLGIEGDTTGSSSISFNKLEATLSSRIIHFRWNVETEEKGDHFVIEKSLDGENWTSVSKVASVKNHKEQHTYEVSEINFAEGVQEYFRIVRVDEFGQITELDRININRPVLTNMLLIPTPKKVNKEVVISYDSMICSTGTITVISEKGDVVLEKSIDISEGYNRYTLDIKGYEQGNYKIVLLDEFENKLSKRLVVHKK